MSENTLFDKSPGEKFNDAILSLIRTDPPLGAMLYGVDFVKTRSERVPDITGDGGTVWWNETWVDESLQSTVNHALLKTFVSMHLGHHLRMPRFATPKERGQWNLACSLAVNSLIRNSVDTGSIPADEPIPGLGRFSAFKHDCASEEYFNGVKEMDFEDGSKSDGDKSANQGGSEGSGSESGLSGSGGDESSRDGQSGSGSGSSGDTGDEGDSPHDDDRDDDRPDDDDANQSQEESGDGEDGDGQGQDQEEGDRDGDGGGSTEEDLPEPVDDSIPAGVGRCAKPNSQYGNMTPEMKHEMTAAAVHHAARTEQFGKSPGWLKTMAEDAETVSKIDWKTQVKRRLLKRCNNGWNYERPSRRHAYRTDIIFPTTLSRTVKRMVLLNDVSGSMDDARCNIAIRELNGIFNAYARVEIILLQCDTRVIVDATRIFHKNDLPVEGLKWYGRGGTNLSPAFPYIRENWPDAAAIICLTDMEWYMADAPDIGIDTIWLNCGRDSREQQLTWLGERGIPSFGTIIRVEPD